MNAVQAQGNPLLDVEWAPCLLEKTRHPELEAFAKHKLGIVPPYVAYLSHCPWLVRAELQMSFDQGLLMHIDNRLAEVVCMAASLEGACRYCYAVSRFMLRLQGMRENRVRDLEKSLAGTADDPKLAAAISFARRMSRSDPLVQHSDKQRLTDVGFSAEEIGEMAYVVAFTVFANRTATIPALSPQAMEKLPDRWAVRLLRPLLARKLLEHVRRGRPISRRPQYTGPYSYLVDAFMPSPIAAVLADSLNGIWEDSALTRRCKGLLLAVVAHALGCPKTAEEAGTILSEEGVDSETHMQVLNHLRADFLDETEALLVPFARETVWYQPAQVQREASQVREKLDSARFTEAVGIVSMANSLCRLGAVMTDRP